MSKHKAGIGPLLLLFLALPWWLKEHFPQGVITEEQGNWAVLLLYFGFFAFAIGYCVAKHYAEKKAEKREQENWLRNLSQKPFKGVR